MRMRRCMLSFVFLALSAFLTGVRPESVNAQGSESPIPEKAGSAGPLDDFQRGTPRSMMEGFLSACRQGDDARTLPYLDLRRFRPAEREEKGLELGRQLCRVLEQTVWIDPQQLSNTAEGDLEDGLPPRRESVALIPTADKPVRVLIERTPREDGVLVWRISADTLLRVPQLYEQFGYGPLEGLLPKPFFEIHFFGVRLWQWIGLALLSLLAVIGGWILSKVVMPFVDWVASRSWVPLREDIIQGSRAPIHLLFAVLLFLSCLPWLHLSVRPAYFVGATAKALAIIAVAWLFMRWVDSLAAWMAERIGNQHALASLLPLGRRTLKLFVGLLALLATLQNLGFNVTSVLAGLGIGGLAVALAAQKSIEQLFGGVTVVADQAIRVGEFCRIGNTVGTVEDIGLRSTRIRTLDRTVLVIPNSDLAAAQIENFSRRDRIRLAATLGLRYETTPDQLRYVLIELKRLLLSHPRVSPDPARVRFAGFGAYSLDVEILAYVETADFNEFLAIREDLFLRIMDIIAQSGTGFAFPSQTVYCATDSGLDRQRTEQAEAQVRQWRAEHRLWLPYPPEEEAAALRGTLAYPPPGSAIG